jgi:CelD/BcsL family acetyltransferase involved in cellulose biosynthesis
VARAPDRELLTRSLVRWLAATRWDVLSALRLPPGSSTGPALVEAARSHRWRLVSNTGVVRSDTYLLDLPARDGPDPHVLGAKARHNLRTEARRFERQGGRYEAVTDAATVPEVVAAIRRLSAERWGAGERTFRDDPAAGPFLVDALQAMAAHGSFRADVARDGTGIRAALVTLVVGRRAVALAIGVSGAEDVRRLSLGKQLFAASIEAAIERGAATYDFLWVGGYKEAFWGARPQRMESLLVGRGLAGRLVAWRASRRSGATVGGSATGSPASGGAGDGS